MATVGKLGKKGIDAVKGISKGVQNVLKGPVGSVVDQVKKQVANVKTHIQSKVAEVKQQLRQLRPSQMELAGAGVDIRRVEDTGTVGKNTPSTNLKPSNNSEPPKNGSNKKPDEAANGTDEVGTPPRYGERRIPTELYKELRKKTPSSKIQKQVNEGLEDKIGTPDPALPGRYITDTLQADHIVSMNNIA